MDADKPAPDKPNLKLLALEREGLEVISAHAQNTCVKRTDMVWLPRQRRFLLAGMRYDWVGAKCRFPGWRDRLPAGRVRVPSASAA